ncbi:hypothetical protein V6N13_034870 [Hibiscus sabdariffa]
MPLLRKELSAGLLSPVSRQRKKTLWLEVVVQEDARIPALFRWQAPIGSTPLSVLPAVKHPVLLAVVPCP